MSPAGFTPAASAPMFQVASDMADLVLRNGRIFTGDRARPHAAALTVSNGLITAVGGEDDVAALIGPDTYLQNTGWTPDGSDVFSHALAIGRGAMPDGLAVQTHVVAENDRVASISLWDGTITRSGSAVDFTSADFLRIEDGVAAEHWDTVDTCSSCEEHQEGCSWREMRAASLARCGWLQRPVAGCWRWRCWARR